MSLPLQQEPREMVINDAMSPDENGAIRELNEQVRELNTTFREYSRKTSVYTRVLLVFVLIQILVAVAQMTQTYIATQGQIAQLLYHIAVAGICFFVIFSMFRLIDKESGKK